MSVPTKEMIVYIKLICIATIVTLVSFMAACSPGVADKGSGTGVGNGVMVGKVVHEDSSPVKDAEVRLRSEKYLADTSGIISTFRTDTTVNITTDSLGFFRIDSIRKGNTYWVEVIDRKDTVESSGTLYVVDVDSGCIEDTFYLSTTTVAPLKTIKGTLVLQGLPQNAYVLIHGMERLAKTDSAGKFTITDLPVGNCEDAKCEYDLKLLVKKDDGTITPFKYELEILRDNSERIIQVELELSDTLDADDFVPGNTFTDSTITLSGFPIRTVLAFSDSSKITVADSSVVFAVKNLQPDTCTGTVCDYSINAYIPKSIGTTQHNRYIMSITKDASGRVVSVKLLIPHI